MDSQERERLFTFDEVLDRARRVAGALEELGVRPQDRVAIVLPTGPEFCDAFFGALLLGAVPVPLYPPVRLGRMEEYHAATAGMLMAVGACVVITDTRIRLLLGRAVGKARPSLGVELCPDLLTRGSPLETRPATDGVALIQFSSAPRWIPNPSR